MRVHLELDHGANQRLVGRLLGERYDVLESDASGEDAALPEADLHILDGRGLSRLEGALRTRKEAERPVYLPVLLLSARATERGPALGVWDVVDDIVRAPVDRTILAARVESLLRARRLSLELHEKNAHLEELNQQKNQLLGMAAHDLRNPLGVIHLYTEHLLGDLDEVLDPTQRRFLDRIHASSTSMVGMIDDLLDLSAIESGRLRLERVPMSLGAAVRTNAEVNQSLAAEKDIRIDVRIGDDLPRVPVDPEKLDQVLNNLLSNAVKYSHSGTTVSVSLERDGDGVLLTVADQGQGIPESQRHNLFTPFGKAGVQSTAGEKSTGLGLAIVKRIVEGHGGTIGVESEEGVGSTFHVRLPAGSPD